MELPAFVRVDGDRRFRDPLTWVLRAGEQGATVRAATELVWSRYLLTPGLPVVGGNPVFHWPIPPSRNIQHGRNPGPRDHHDGRILVHLGTE